jgi:hypothetical protein
MHHFHHCCGFAASRPRDYNSRPFRVFDNQPLVRIQWNCTHESSLEILMNAVDKVLRVKLVRKLPVEEPPSNPEHKKRQLKTYALPKSGPDKPENLPHVSPV